MGGLTSKTFKPRKHDKKDANEEEKRTSVTDVEHRDKEFKLSRETKSAYYYGRKNGVAEGVDKSDNAAEQKRVVLQRAGGSDQTVFKRVRETPTAIYFEPNDFDDGTDAAPQSGKEDDKEKKNIVLENIPVVEKRIKVIRDGSSDITIRPESITIQKHDMIIDHTIGKKPRSNVLNTYSVMVKNKESDAVPSATVTLDDDKGLTAIQEGKERESQLIEEENTNDSTLQNGQNEASSNQEEERKLSTGNDDQKDRQSSTGDSMDPEHDTINSDNVIAPNHDTDKESVVKSVDDKVGNEQMSSKGGSSESTDTTSGERESNECETRDLDKEKTDNDTNDNEELNKLNDRVAENDSCSITKNITERTHLNVDRNLNGETLSSNSEPNIISDKDSGISIRRDSEYDKHL